MRNRSIKQTALYFIVMCLGAFFLMGAEGCDSSQESKDRAVVQDQQSHYSKVQPLPFYDYSIPRDIVVQIYNVVTQESRSTYTVIESVTGVDRKSVV